jgi:hypothetical protein
MTAREMDAMARRWERSIPLLTEPRRTPEEALLDTCYERWKAESPPGCIPCLVEELE